MRSTGSARGTAREFSSHGRLFFLMTSFFKMPLDAVGHLYWVHPPIVHPREGLIPLSLLHLAAEGALLSPTRLLLYLLCSWSLLLRLFPTVPLFTCHLPSFPTSQRSCSFAVGTDLPGRGEHPLYSAIFISIPSFLCFWAAPCWCYCLAFVNTLLIWASPVCLQKAMASVWPQILLPLPPFHLFHCQLFGFIFLGFCCSFAAVVLQVLFSLCASANL